MAPPDAGGTSASASAAPVSPHREEEAAIKRRCCPARGAGAWARVLSMGVQGVAMTAALASSASRPTRPVVLLRMSAFRTRERLVGVPCGPLSLPGASGRQTAEVSRVPHF